MTALVGVASVAGLVWLGAVLWRGGPLAGALLVLLAGTCFGYIFFHADTGFVPLTTDRLLFVLVLAQAALYRKLGWAAPKPIGKAEIVLAAFLGALCLSTLAHDWTYQGNLPVSKLLFYYLLPAGMYWVARQV